ncbi:hypothetical protein [Nonomuraea jiangxiensis]|uniref:Uncharacterized protein n=1 Tax=Nonomuraea jiangxiensis TaxID=633440 RepID=A0A1G9JFR5_9ACTN|nr:hypothetical protein [Nonomuraea jiangxiensis]SDL36410.1 hypothetical protein SAMN05421869_12528 [Nonomuraea jiangxiensis]
MARTSSRRSRRAALAGALLTSVLLTMSTATPANAVTVPVQVHYIDQDGWGTTKYDVRFNGTVSSYGPHGYVIQGELDAYCHHGAMTRQSVRLDYGATHRGWQDVRFWCDETPVPIYLHGQRDYGDSVDLKVGATSGVFNTYNFGSTYRISIGTD